MRRPAAAKTAFARAGARRDQDLAGTRRGRARRRPRVDHRAAAERAHIERAHVGVAHDHAHGGERHPQLVGHQLRQGRAVVLADVDLAGERRDGAVRADVAPGAAVSKPAPCRGGAAGPRPVPRPTARSSRARPRGSGPMAAPAAPPRRPARGLRQPASETARSRPAPAPPHPARPAGWPGSRSSGRCGRPWPPGWRRRGRAGGRRSSAVVASTMPGVQYPHCMAPVSTMACRTAVVARGGMEGPRGPRAEITPPGEAQAPWPTS